MTKVEEAVEIIRALGLPRGQQNERSALTIWRQTIHQFEQARIVDRNPDDESRPTNSGKNVYALTDDAVAVLRRYGSRQFNHAIDRFAARFGELERTYACRRDLKKVRLRLPRGSMPSGMSRSKPCSPLVRPIASMLQRSGTGRRFASSRQTLRGKPRSGLLRRQIT